MYIVSFVPRDGGAVEEYYYHQFTDAEYHFSMFGAEDAELYSEINLIRWEGNIETVLKSKQLLLNCID